MAVGTIIFSVRRGGDSVRIVQHHQVAALPWEVGSRRLAALPLLQPGAEPGRDQHAGSDLHCLRAARRNPRPLLLLRPFLCSASHADALGSVRVPDSLATVLSLIRIFLCNFTSLRHSPLPFLLSSRI
ncbi:hypothetical protein U1Q18_012143 [Sarracenia purpurea var. burkii]